jgi:hypothetical protein
MKKLYLVILLSVLVLYSCSDKAVNNTQLHAVHGIIRGNVYDSATKHPVFNAKVVALGFSDSKYQSFDSCMTDSNGFYIVQVTSLLYIKNNTGHAGLEIYKDGYKIWTGNPIYFQDQDIIEVIPFLDKQ